MVGSSREDRLLVPLSALGVILFSVIYGYQQERLFGQEYGEGDDSEFFKGYAFVSNIQCAINIFWALAQWRVQGGRSDIPWHIHLATSASYLAASILTSRSLKYVTFITQVLAKSCKPLPIFFMNMMFHKRRYSGPRIAAIVFLVGGLILYQVYEPPSGSQSPEQEQTKNHMIGVGLLTLALMCDGITGTLQEHMRSSYHAISYVMMFYLNLYATILATILNYTSGELVESLRFIDRHPEILNNLWVCAFCSLSTQICVFIVLQKSGPLSLAMITSVRKAISITVSAIAYDHAVLGVQGLGIILSFIGAGLEALVLIGHVKDHSAIMNKSSATYQPLPLHKV
eukprot:Clim_evm20s149 gene=Clim_evmTU20s149